jgi:Caspase domain
VVEDQTTRVNGSAGESKSKRYAVVVGVNDYTEAGIGSLSFCVADAEAFYDALLTYCEYDPDCVILFSDGSHQKAQKPLRSDILAAISDMATRATDEDSILFFFAGHGTRDPRDSYLLTQEFRTQIVADTSIPMDKINDYFRHSKAKFIMRFFDACHSGRIGARAVPVGPDIKKHFLVEAEGWATLAACKEDQYAHEDPVLGHGVFSYCLVKGLSGEATTSDKKVTLHSLSMYTITQTSDITSELGLPQTPVFGGTLAGELVLATIYPTRPTAIPPALVKVEETTIDQLKPTPEKIPQFVADIRSLLLDDPLQLDYVAPSQEEKLALGEKLVQKVYNWCQEQERQYHKQLEGLLTVTVKLQSIQECPLNLQLAEYIQDSEIKQSVALRPIYKTEHVPSKFWQLGFLGGYETREVLDGISEKQGQYKSAVLLTLWTKELLMPVCAMVVAIIPATFGLYLLRYTSSTQLDHVQKEYWNPATLSVRTLHAIPFADKEGVQTLEELQDLYPQLVSFFAESCSARKSYLQSIGITGQSLL